MTSLDRVMLNVWECLPASDRRVLAVIANCQALDAELSQGKFVSWEELQTADRVALIRSMRVIGDLAMTCAAVLETARGVLEEEAPPSPREQLIAGVAKLVDVEPAFIKRHLRR